MWCHCIRRLKTITAPLFGSFGFGVAETNSHPSFALAFKAPGSKSAFRKSVCVLYSQRAVLCVVQQPAKNRVLAINPSAMCFSMTSNGTPRHAYGFGLSRSQNGIRNTPVMMRSGGHDFLIRELASPNAHEPTNRRFPTADGHVASSFAPQPLPDKPADCSGEFYAAFALLWSSVRNLIAASLDANARKGM